MRCAGLTICALSGSFTPASRSHCWQDTHISTRQYNIYRSKSPLLRKRKLNAWSVIRRPKRIILQAGDIVSRCASHVMTNKLAYLFTNISKPADISLAQLWKLKLILRDTYFHNDNKYDDEWRCQRGSLGLCHCHPTDRTHFMKYDKKKDKWQTRTWRVRQCI